MRIGLLIYGDIETLSGGYLYDRKLVEHCRRQGDEVEIISLGEKPAYPKALFNNTIPDQLTELDLDVLIQDELVHPSCYRINTKLKTVLACPVVSLVHLFNCYRPAGKLKKFLYRHIERLYLNTVDALILNSRSTKTQAEELLKGTLPPHIIAYPCGDNFSLDEKEPEKADMNPDSLKVLFVGNITKQKNLHVLIEALDLSGNKKTSVTIVGNEDIDVKYVERIKHYINGRGLQAQVNFRGVVQDEALKTIYQSHDLFVMPSVNEAYGIVFLEAMQFALPVIGSNAGGSKEIIRHGGNGYLIAPGASRELAELLNTLQEDRALLKQLSERAVAAYRQHPVWQDTCIQIRSFLQELIANGGRQT